MFLGMLFWKNKKEVSGIRMKHIGKISQNKTESEITFENLKNTTEGISAFNIRRVVEVEPGLTARILDQWLSLSPIIGSQNCALFFKTLPKTYQRLLRKYFPNEKLQLVQKAAIRMNNEKDHEVGRVLHDFQTDLGRFTNLSRNPVRYKSLHHF